MNWHGISSKFSDHYIDRQSNDKSIFKSTKLTILKRLKDYAVMVEKKELQEFDNVRQILLLKKKKEKAKHSRLVALLENNKALDKRMESAALLIQRWARGFLVRRQYKDEIWKITLKLLTGKVDSLEVTVDKCLKFIGDTAKHAATVIQKHARRYLAQKRYKNMKDEFYEHQERLKNEKAVAIQKIVRGHLARKRVNSMKEAKLMNSKLEAIRIKLLILRLKEFWHRKKFVWDVIRRKYRDRLDPESTFDERPSIHHESIKENTGTLSNIVSATSSHIFTQRNSILLREPIPILLEKPPKVPKPLTLKYLKPTQAFLSRITNDPEPKEDKEKTAKLKKIRSISGRRYQRNTTSRTRYINVLQTESQVKSRAASADYRKRRDMRSFEKPAEKSEEPKTSNALALLFDNEVPKYFNNKNKTPAPATLLSRLEDQPSIFDEEITEKLYLYKPPKFQSLSFRDALPDVNALLETYGKSFKK